MRARLRWARVRDNALRELGGIPPPQEHVPLRAVRGLRASFLGAFQANFFLSWRKAALLKKIAPAAAIVSIV